MNDFNARRWPSAEICCLLLVLIVGCSSKEPQVIDPTDLKNIKLGEVVHLSGMLKKPAEAVCVLTPYRDALDESESLSRQVNAHLKAMNYAGDEGHWALAFVNADAATVQIVRVAPGLRIILPIMKACPQTSGRSLARTSPALW